MDFAYIEENEKKDIIYASCLLGFTQVAMFVSLGVLFHLVNSSFESVQYLRLRGNQAGASDSQILSLEKYIYLCPVTSEEKQANYQTERYHRHELGNDVSFLAC